MKTKVLLILILTLILSGCSRYAKFDYSPSKSKLQSEPTKKEIRANNREWKRTCNKYFEYKNCSKADIKRIIQKQQEKN